MRQRVNGEAIRSLRKMRGLTCEGLAARVPIASSALRLIENGGTARPTVLTLQGIARALDVAVEQIVIDEDAEDPSAVSA